MTGDQVLLERYVKEIRLGVVRSSRCTVPVVERGAVESVAVLECF